MTDDTYQCVPATSLRKNGLSHKTLGHAKPTLVFHLSCRYSFYLVGGEQQLLEYFDAALQFPHCKEWSVKEALELQH